MPNPLFDLQNLLAGKTSLAGRVLAISNGMVRIATSKGMIELPSDGTLNVGNNVTVLDERAVRVQNEADAPVFFV